MGETYLWNKLNLRLSQDIAYWKCELEFKNNVRTASQVQ